ncbi:MAG TPA: hypothetical protein VNB29_03005 [Chthoniobacterales bacterium]|nr:hypothetical protein [Chthoniobacterales bacterium]
MKKDASTRLWVILAREAPVAAIFRRGSSRHVQLIKWNLETDTFEDGQWFKGRVYERRCDLSPDGGLLLYFAATYKEPLQSWTAVSKLPWFTALALWPKGDGWNGGGYFTGLHDIHLDHFSHEAELHPEFAAQGRKLRVSSLADARGEDAPVWRFTLRRAGWELVCEGEWSGYGDHKGYSWKAAVAETWRRGHPGQSLVLHMFIEGLNKENGPWYVTSYRVTDSHDAVVMDLGLADWAEWDARGDLLFARDGRLYRQTIGPSPFAEPTLLADFANRKFEAIAAPEWARTF